MQASSFDEDEHKDKHKAKHTFKKYAPLTKKNTNKNTTTKSKYIGSSKTRFSSNMIVRLNFKVDPWDALQAWRRNDSELSDIVSTV